MPVTLSNLHHVESTAPIGADGKVSLKAQGGIVRFNVSFDGGEKIPHLEFQIAPWAERLEGLSVDGADVRHEANLVSVEITNGTLHVVFTQEGLAKIKSGSQIQFIDFFR